MNKILFRYRGTIDYRWEIGVRVDVVIGYATPGYRFVLFSPSRHLSSASQWLSLLAGSKGVDEGVISDQDGNEYSYKDFNALFWAALKLPVPPIDKPYMLVNNVPVISGAYKPD